jgi:DNA (cytosine-5)-methyltransferase 1
MTPPRVFDGFCKAGGAGEGYARAGFEVVGMDIVAQPRNPHPFLLGNVLEVTPGQLEDFDLLHFSPPCQGYTEMRAPGQLGAPRLIDAVRELAQASGVPYVIENVRAARPHMKDPVKLSGEMFDLAAYGGRLLRERLFECSFPVLPYLAGVKSFMNMPVIGIYGGHVRIRSGAQRGQSREGWLPAGVSHRDVASRLMDIDWMTLDELSEAIPPAYTQHIGREFLDHRAQKSPVT